MGQIKRAVLQDPFEEVPYLFDWTAFLLARGETIATSVFVLSGTITAVSTPAAGTLTAIIVIGAAAGVVGTTYQVDHRITTSGGYKFERSLSITII